MIHITEKENCCGCMACITVCPSKAIQMKTDNEGFEYPLFDKELCIGCGCCDQVCQYYKKDHKTEIWEIPTFACKHKELNIRKNSSSGGVFYALLSKIIEYGGVVFGAVYDNNHSVAHIAAEDINSAKAMMGSKYVQSYIGTAYAEAEAYLNKGRVVLFTGTPCQIIGLKLYLKKDYPALYTVEIVCHGVPSPELFYKYCCSLEQRWGKLESYNFRGKSCGWSDFKIEAKFEKKEYNIYHGKDPYMKAFLKNLTLRPSCHNCMAHRLDKSADLILGDYWGVFRIHPEFADNLGVSLVLAVTDKGYALLQSCSASLEIISGNLKAASLSNPCLIYPTKQGKTRRALFASNWRTDTYNSLKKAVKPTNKELLKEITLMVKRQLKRILRK